MFLCRPHRSRLSTLASAHHVLRSRHGAIRHVTIRHVQSKPPLFQKPDKNPPASPVNQLMYRGGPSLDCEHFVSWITPCPKLKSDGRDHEALLLFTPEYANRLQPDSVFLSDIVNRIYRQFAQPTKEPLSLRTVVAVVDRLCRPQSATVPPRLLEHDDSGPQSSRLGGDGMAYVVGSKATIALKCTSAEDVPAGGDKFISICIKTPQPSPDIPTASFQVPLANTVFHTGKENVLFVAEWTKTRDKTVFVYEKALELASAGINWPLGMLADQEGGGGKFEFSAPLLPLTDPRRIVASTGNVLAQISSEDNPSAVQPASSELEKAISSYFAARNMSPCAVGVWALTVPEETLRSVEDRQTPSTDTKSGVPVTSGKDDLWRSWKNGARLSETTILQLIRRGARLHRVLSGGGGWGKKAGLISLDPDSSFGHYDLEDTLEPGDASIFGDAARIGDCIQFFIYHREAVNTARQEDKRSWSLDVGTSPSTIDAMPRDDLDEVPTGWNAAVYPGHLGILSERGVGMVVETHGQPGNAFKTQTKIDVPLSRLTVSGAVIDPKPGVPGKSRKNSRPFVSVERPEQSQSLIHNIGSGKEFPPAEAPASATAAKQADQITIKADRADSHTFRWKAGHISTCSQKACRSEGYKDCNSKNSFRKVCHSEIYS
ncbi:hypothetical protein EJ06DRAFT_135315 [Trichodelitschia bisporula]|uniref:Uncharacterized protein n=1 Tax=Trichodelitschia bisporula TaxID=703511 RepID=A0A6G1HPI1_9PEZI|nr:hypothetical protein EJ06DRAFT_135315 [Trichodelitschia bisporula]